MILVTLVIYAFVEAVVAVLRLAKVMLILAVIIAVGIVALAQRLRAARR